MSHKKQGLALTLTKDALEALFPVGTQAYTDLRQSVLQNFVDSHIKPRIDSGVDRYGQQVLANVKKGLLEELQKMGREISIDTTNALEFRTVVAGCVNREVAKLVPVMVENAINARFDTLKLEIDQQVAAYTSRVKDNVTKQLSRAIANNVIHHLQDTLNHQLEKQIENTNQN